MILAINGGKRLSKKRPVSKKIYGDKEIIQERISKIIKNGILSGYRGNFIPAFWGGDYVQELEELFLQKTGAKYALAVNSCTSALHILCAALEINPGDEVIVSPFSMSCSATAPMMSGGIPVFADISRDHFMLDPDKVREKITDKTKAIIVVDLFGQVYPKELDILANEFNIPIIEDAAQALGAYRNIGTGENPDLKHAGRMGKAGVFSFTQGKHISSGEGGMIITDDKDLYFKCALIRNHAEAVVSAMPENKQSNFSQFVGYNMRMTELQAAVLIEQIPYFYISNVPEQKRNNVVDIKESIFPMANIIEKKPIIGNKHSYYVLPFLYNKDKADFQTTGTTWKRGPDRDTFINAVKAELLPEQDREDRGVPIGNGYIKPLYLMPVFQYKKHWSIDAQPANYHEGLCPVAEKLYTEELFITLYQSFDTEIISDVGNAFKKVWANRSELV